MLPAIIKASLIVIFSLITMITLHITVPTILLLDDQSYFNSMKLMVIRVYICLTAVIVLETILIYISIFLLYMTSDWIIATYIPLLVYSVYHTYNTCVVNLASRINVKEAKDFLLEHWNRYIALDDKLWLTIQLKLNCCGLDGPRTYLDYLRKVHNSCYVDQMQNDLLITRGCYDVIYDDFNGVHYLAIALAWFSVILQLIILALYTGFLLRKRRKYLLAKLQKLRIKTFKK